MSEVLGAVADFATGGLYSAGKAAVDVGQGIASGNIGEALSAAPEAVSIGARGLAEDIPTDTLGKTSALGEAVQTGFKAGDTIASAGVGSGAFAGQAAEGALASDIGLTATLPEGQAALAESGGAAVAPVAGGAPAGTSAFDFGNAAVRTAPALIGAGASLIAGKAAGLDRAPNIPAGPQAPDPEAIARAAQIKNQQDNAVRSTDLVNPQGSKGVLSGDPNAQYKKKVLLGA